MKTSASNSDLSSVVVENMFFRGISTFITKFGGMVFTIFLARLLFPEVFGIYSLVFTIIILIENLTSFGIGTTIPRYVSESLAKKDGEKEARSRLLFLINLRLIVLFAFAAVIYFSAGHLALFFKKPLLLIPLKIGAFYFFVSGIYETFFPIFLSTQKVKYSTIVEVVLQASKLCLLFTLFLNYRTVESAFLVLIVSSLIAVFAATTFLLKKFRFLVKGQTQPVERKRLVTFSAYLSLASLSVIVFTGIDKLFLGYFLESNFVGYYSAIITLVGGILGLWGISSVILPAFTQLESKSLETAVIKTFKYLSLIVFPASFGFAFVLMPLLKVLYGSSYLPAQYLFSIFLTGIFLALIIIESGFSGVYSMLLNAKERPKAPAMFITISSVINIVLNCILIVSLVRISPSYGLIGAGAATFVSRYVNMMLLAVFCKKNLKISPLPKDLLKPAFASLLMISSLGFAAKIMPLVNWYSLVAHVILGAICYTLFISLLRGLDVREIKMLLLTLRVSKG